MSPRLRRIGALLAAALLGLPGQAAAAQATSGSGASAVRPAVDQAALQLAKLVALPLEADVQLARRTIEIAFDNDEGKEIKALYPGLLPALWAAVEPEIRLSLARDHEVYEGRLAALFVRQLTLAEIEALDRFYRTPTGRKLIQTMQQASSSDEFLAGVLRDESVSEGSYASARQEGQKQVLQSIDSTDFPALADLGRSIPLAKMRAVGADVQKVMLDWVNEPDPEFEERVGRIVEGFVKKYIAEHPPEE